MMKKMTLRTLPALLSLAFAGTAVAASLQVMEQDASGIATSFAGSAAVAENAATNYYNPAGLTQLKGFQFSAGVTGVKSNVEYSGAGVSGGNAGDTLASPNLYVSLPLTQDLYVGFGVSRPFALSTEYDAGWAGNGSVIKAEIKTVNYNPSLAYRLNDKVSLGLGLNYQKLDFTVTDSTPPASFIGDDSATGWNAGALFTLSPAMRVGLAYRSGLNYSLNGTAAGELKLPGTFTLSVWQQVSDRWEAMGDLSLTQWNRFDKSTVPVIATADQRNSWRFAWGAAYKYNDVLKAKFGFGYERAATRDENLNLAAPENDRITLSLGAQMKVGSASKLDFGYAYKFSRDANVNQAPVVGKYETSGHVLGLQYSAGF